MREPMWRAATMHNIGAEDRERVAMQVTVVHATATCSEALNVK